MDFSQIAPKIEFSQSVPKMDFQQSVLKLDFHQSVPKIDFSQNAPKNGVLTKSPKNRLCTKCSKNSKTIKRVKLARVLKKASLRKTYNLTTIKTLHLTASKWLTQWKQLEAKNISWVYMKLRKSVYPASATSNLFWIMELIVSLMGIGEPNRGSLNPDIQLINHYIVPHIIFDEITIHFGGFWIFPFLEHFVKSSFFGHFVKSPFLGHFVKTPFLGSFVQKSIFGGIFL